MRRFYFEVDDDGHVYPDTEGQELESKEEALRIALAMIPRLSVPPGDRRRRYDLAVHVKDESGAWVLTARLSLSVEMPD